MDNLENKIMDINHNYYKFLLNLKNVNGIGFGFKEKNDLNTLEPCIHVLVEDKIDEKYLSKNNIIPKSYMGIKTDVIKAKKPKIRTDEIPYMFRPLEGGCVISPNIKTKNTNRYLKGTLGCIVTKVIDGKKEFFILSNNHVLANTNEFPIGTPIIQPNKLNGGSDLDVVASLYTFVPLNFITETEEPINYMDAAIGKISNNSLISNEIYLLNNIMGVSKATPTLAVKKVGFKTGLTKGRVVSTGVTTNVTFSDNKEAHFQDQVYAKFINDDGDSGSVVLNRNNEVVGLFFAGIDKDAYFSDIDKVLSEFKVNIYI